MTHAEEPSTDSAPLATRKGGKVLFASLVTLILAAVVKYSGAWWDQQFANIATAVLIAVTIILFQIGWSRKATTRLQGALPALTLGLAVIMFFSFFRFVGFSGELIPRFAWRSQPAAELPKDTQEASTTERTWQTDDPDAFTGFLGNDRRAFIAKRQFDTDWNNHPPRIVWQQPIGAGWSGFVIASGLAFTMEQRDEEEWVSCYDLRNGQLVWHYATKGLHFHPLGGTGPRATPTIAGTHVLAQSAEGILTCLEAVTGKLVWSQDIFKLLGIDKAAAEAAVTWGRSGSPLIYKDLVIVPGGGPVDQAISLLAFRADTGELVWKGGNQQISYASPQTVTLSGVEQIVIVNESSVTGHDPTDGKTLWKHDWPGASNAGASVSQAMPVNDHQLLLSKGYGGGGALLEFTRDADQLVATEVWHKPSVLKTKFTNAVVQGDYAYALPMARWNVSTFRKKVSRFGNNLVANDQDKDKSSVLRIAYWCSAKKAQSPPLP